MIRERSLHHINAKLDLVLKNQEQIMSNQDFHRPAARLRAVIVSPASRVGSPRSTRRSRTCRRKVAANSGDNLTPATQALLDQIATQSAALAQTANTIPGATPPATPPSP